MKEKLKARFNEFKSEPFRQGTVFGFGAGFVVTLGVMVVTKANFTDPKTNLHIPDHIVEHVLKTGLPAMITRHDGVQLMIGPS